MSHTPGPWKRYRDKNGRVSKIEGKGYRVCTFQPSDPNTNNDSALIEAAPDMLAALEDILSGWLYIRQVHGDLSGVGWDRAQEKVDAAIRKARGEE